jgi:hypothetical protein
MNALVSEPGEFGSFGHDYRADMARFVRDTYGFPTTSEAQLDSIENTLRTREMERADILAAKRTSPPSSPAIEESGDTLRGGVPLRKPRTRGARWVRRRGPHALAQDASGNRSGRLTLGRCGRINLGREHA